MPSPEPGTVGREMLSKESGTGVDFGRKKSTTPVSYTHLTLPTNREV